MARMVPDSLSYPSIPRLAQCDGWRRGFTGPAAVVWGHRDPVLGKSFHRVRRAVPNARVWETQAGHFLQEEVPEQIALSDPPRHHLVRAATGRGE